MITGNLFEGLGGAQIFDRGKYFKPNFDGVVIVRKTLAKATRNKGIAFIVELEVEQSNLPQDHPVGSKGTWFQKLIDKDVAFPAIKVWAAACGGFHSHQKDEIEQTLCCINPETNNVLLDDLVNYAVHNPDTNDFVGQRLRLATQQVKTKNNTDFTRYDFSPA